MERKSREVMNMLIAEYDYDTDIAVQREEERETAFAAGSHQKALETAKRMRSHDYQVSEICAMTGLSKEEVENL